MEQLVMGFHDSLANSNFNNIKCNEVSDVSKQLYFEIRNKMYELKEKNLQVALIREVLYDLNHFDSFYVYNNNGGKTINFYDDSIGDNLYSKKLENLTTDELTFVMLSGTFGSLIRGIVQLCYFFDINLNEIIKEHLKNYGYDTDNELFSRKFTTYNDSTKFDKVKSFVKQLLTFQGLFKLPYCNDKKQKELKELLKGNGYIDNNYEWVGITKKKNELAFLYYYFKDTPDIIQPGNFETQIKVFYKEFGLTVYNDKEPKGYCTVKGLKNNSPDNETYENFKVKFSEWIK